ncbi:carbonic anhydrase [Armillaria novae-zelandiae]|uniref:Carbonic anhydrase n=1 Tax=Armillaria novae-zelandiae TaxID=153914 RepID=A0AA39P773_9AGAR|nr:carbonic anhydrase [Armillaria novae-zelandiae]
MLSRRITSSTRQLFCNTAPTLFSSRYCSKIEMPESPSENPIALPPKKRLAIVTCMDARINPFTQLGLEEGDAHIIRNAGGMAKDALRSIIISQRLLGTREIAVYHHTGCGMVTFTSPSLRRMLSDSDPENPRVADQANKIDFLEFDNLEQSVRDDVKFLKECPLVLKDTKITGWIHYVETSKAVQVV